MTNEDVIFARRSVRTFIGQPVTDAQIASIEEAVNPVVSPFGGNMIVRIRNYELHGVQRPGTYGTVSGAVTYFLLAYDDEPRSALTAGYMMEHRMLAATALGLGTCWIGGTFKSSDFGRGEEWPQGMSLRIISPVGIPAERENLRGRITRLAIRADRRKPFGELFFDSVFGVPLAEGSYFGHALSMLRLAPSSTNSQPWRAVVCGDTVHFYYKDKSTYSLVDMGIALCHFHLTAPDGAFIKADDHPEASDGLHYLISYR